MINLESPKQIHQLYQVNRISEIVSKLMNDLLNQANPIWTKQLRWFWNLNSNSKKLTKTNLLYVLSWVWKKIKPCLYSLILSKTMRRQTVKYLQLKKFWHMCRVWSKKNHLILHFQMRKCRKQIMKSSSKEIQLLKTHWVFELIRPESHSRNNDTMKHPSPQMLKMKSMSKFKDELAINRWQLIKWQITACF